MAKHIIICGERGVGKSTLIENLVERSTRPISGFVTKKLAPDETGFHPIYIHPAGARPDEREYGESNLIGTCNARIHNINLDVFNTLGVRYLQAQSGSLIVMDELGFMEAEAEMFVKSVHDAFRGSVPVIAAVKSRYDVAFLNEVRAHDTADVYNITENNRDELYTKLLPTVLEWNKSCASRV